jgi:hypothetical protein
MSIFTVLLIIFTGAMGIVTATLYGILLLTKLSLMDYEKAGRVSFVVSFISIVALLAFSGESYAIVCTWMSGVSLLLIFGILVGLLIRSTDWRR